MTVQLQRTGTGRAHGLATGAWLQRSLCAPPPPAQRSPWQKPRCIRRAMHPA